MWELFTRVTQQTPGCGGDWRHPAGPSGTQLDAPSCHAMEQWTPLAVTLFSCLDLGNPLYLFPSAASHIVFLWTPRQEEKHFHGACQARDTNHPTSKEITSPIAEIMPMRFSCLFVLYN